MTAIRVKAKRGDLDASGRNHVRNGVGRPSPRQLPHRAHPRCDRRLKLLVQPASTVEDIDEAIWRAGRKLGWSIAVLSPGRLRGTFHHRRHVAVVSIAHDGQLFSIRFEGSENLREDRDRIHERYNVWVARLAEKIEAEAATPMTRHAPDE